MCKEDLLAIKGIREKRFGLYGEDILTIIQECAGNCQRKRLYFSFADSKKIESRLRPSRQIAGSLGGKWTRGVGQRDNTEEIYRRMRN